MVKDNKNVADDSMGNYLIIWKYKIMPEMKDVFEKEYGSTGQWNELFSDSNNYRGSYLNKNEEEADTYFLIDIWTDKQSYEDFKKINLDKYNKLSGGFENLYISEERIGTFHRIQ